MASSTDSEEQERRGRRVSGRSLARRGISYSESETEDFSASSSGYEDEGMNECTFILAFEV